MTQSDPPGSRPHAPRGELTRHPEPASRSKVKCRRLRGSTAVNALSHVGTRSSHGRRGTEDYRAQVPTAEWTLRPRASVGGTTCEAAPLGARRGGSGRGDVPVPEHPLVPCRDPRSAASRVASSCRRLTNRTRCEGRGHMSLTCASTPGLHRAAHDCGRFRADGGRLGGFLAAAVSRASSKFAERRNGDTVGSFFFRAVSRPRWSRREASPVTVR